MATRETTVSSWTSVLGIALGVGVVYGIVHRNSLTRKAEYKRQQDEYAFKEELIKEAKAEYQKKKNSGSGSSMFGLWERH